MSPVDASQNPSHPAVATTRALAREVLTRLRRAADDPARSVALTLAVPFAYHGFWTLSASGSHFWANESGLPAALRFAVGPLEVAIALCLLLGAFVRFAGGAIVVLMLGAFPQHLANGYSFKRSGVEVIVAYSMLGLALALHARKAPRATEEEPTPSRRS